MATSAIDSASLASSTKAAGLSMDDLLKLLMTELTYQDPLKPVENKDFLTQMAQFSSLDTTRQLNESIEKMLSLQSLNQTVGLLGKTVDAVNDTGTVSGQVTALQLVSGDPQITIKTSTGEIITGLTMAQVQTIR
ncbi:MAG: flagellar hook capping FlgD N-terminal domain-containing protein [Aquabacterium sp.]|uniref:flagellar hook capping FlgD N-terminal domain-containing protein n=1 Tax=Aquabacterium sp. TaxID=1872578 RepID=UPI00271EC5AF|nr:flagellar hook capping FlgD N-terminal domain-containing protein [Aquabacterium sp.]MDO9005733.1 flagellar hook capping FlgD N-terminal domain-containing protein [Aquabacterium sp.]